MTEAKNVMVFIEADRGRIADVSLELVCEAGRLAERLGGTVEAAAMGYGMTEALADLGRYGCRRVYYTEDRRLERFTSVPYARVTADIIRRRVPKVVLFGASTTGRDVAPRVASILRCGLTADCTELGVGDYRFKDRRWEDVLLQIRPAFGGNIVATIVSPESVPSMASVREGVMRLIESDPEARAEVVREAVDLGDGDFPTEIIEVMAQERCVDLKSARIIVAAGVGASDPESLKLVRQLARLLGGVVGASRPVVDACVLPRDHQVGQTGTTVRPNLYVACGISGQIQHRAGMAESKRIIAINRDPDAPIFDVAHYGIVGDVREVIPRMIKAYKVRGTL
jgi:electron transfer flavoprotein alpha subunit